MPPEIKDKIITPKAVCAITSLSRTTIWRKEREGSFPRSIRLSENRIGWSLLAVEAWLADRAMDVRRAA